MQMTEQATSCLQASGISGAHHDHVYCTRIQPGNSCYPHHLCQCRYLAESGCVGMCVNLCKTPTQTFFTEELGMPLTMKPNFDDYRCDMIFGQTPPSLDTDEVNSQACYNACPQGIAGNSKCPKLG